MFLICFSLTAPHKNVGSRLYLCEYSTLPKGKTFITKGNTIMKNLNNKNFDTALDSNAKATQHITEIRYMESHNPFMSKFLVEGNGKNCEYMISQAKKKIVEYEGNISTEFANNPEQPSDSVLLTQESNIRTKEEQIDEWIEERDYIVKQLIITYPDWQPRNSVATSALSQEQKDKLIAAAKKRVATK